MDRIKVLGLFLSIAYVAGDCGIPPTIQYSRNNITEMYSYSEKAVVEYSCLLGYRPDGNAIYTCSNEKWMGGPFSCHIMECLPLGSPKNGRKIGNGSEIGYVARFECNTGYELIGSVTSQCRLNLKWQPSTIPECRRRQCQKDLLIEHGNVTTEITVDGQSDIYGAVLRVHCNEGYIRSGPVTVHCNENGQWTEKPKCKPVKCPPYPGLDRKCVEKTKTDYQNTLLLIFCTPNSTFIHHGDRAVRCENNTWDDLSHGCFCDCKVSTENKHYYFHNLNSNRLLKHNEILLWSCENNGINSTGKPLICNDGLVEIPICPSAKTSINPTIFWILGVVIAVLVIVCALIVSLHWYGAKSSGTNRETAYSLASSQSIHDSPASSKRLPSSQNHMQALSTENSCASEGKTTLVQRNEGSFVNIYIEAGSQEETPILTPDGKELQMEEVDDTGQPLASLSQLSNDESPESANKVNSEMDLSEKQQECSTKTLQTDLSENYQDCSTQPSSCLLS